MSSLSPALAGGFFITWSHLGNPSLITFLFLDVCSIIQLFVTPWTVTHQAPLSMGFSRQEHWSGLPYLPLDILRSSNISKFCFRGTKIDKNNLNCLDKELYAKFYCYTTSATGQLFAPDTVLRTLCGLFNLVLFMTMKHKYF